MTETTIRRKLKSIGARLKVETEMYTHAKRYCVVDGQGRIIDAFNDLDELWRVWQHEWESNN